MLGPFEVRSEDGSFVDVPGPRLRALLIALALRPGHAVPKAPLVDWIWGARPPADATNALQRLVSRLRKVLPDGVVEGRTDGYRLLLEPDAVDAVRFERLVTVAQAARAEDGSRRVQLLRDALDLWRGTAMQDVGLPDSPAFDAAAARLEALRLTAAEECFDAEITLGRGAGMVTELTDLVAANPVRERLVAALMRALVAAGRDSEALVVYQRAREALADALGADPSPELAALHVALLRGELGRGTERHREESPRTNLRAELTTFVGTGTDVAAVRGLVAEHRLTTVIGPGGAGKTRLATETARTLLGELPDGAWLVELAAIGPEGDVAQATLAGLGLRDALLGGAANAEPTDRLIAAIREREALLILDNCEHVVESAAVFAHRVLGECRRLRILATSREPLGITGEALWQVEPLALPPAEAGPAEIEAAPAVQLLRDRAGAVRRDLAGDPDTLATMVRVCRALDGMPLAIELAAARLRTMSVEQLANRLDDRFRLLTGGSRTALPRHKTLRAAVDWSWELLGDAERAVLRRLAVFSGGASLQAAEHVCADDTAYRAEPTRSDDPTRPQERPAAGQPATEQPTVDRDQVLELLTSLTEKSLLRAEGDTAPRYRMMATIQEYAEQRLAEAGELERTRRAHLAYFTELAETAEPHLRRAGQLDWLAVLEADHDNIAAAMRTALAADDAQATMRLAAGCGWYWWLAGHKTEGFELLTRAARMPGEASDDVRAMVYALVVLFVSSGRRDEHEAEVWIREAHRHSRRSTGRYPLLGLMAALERLLDGPEAFLSAFEPLLDDEDPWVRALARLHMGKMRIVLGKEGRDGEAYLETALAEFRAIGDRFGISFALTELADRLAGHGEFARACEYFEQAIEVVTEVGGSEDVIRMRARQAQLHWLMGDREAASAAVAEARRIAERVTWPDALAELAFAQAGLARWDGDSAEAYRQLDVATALLGEEAEQPHIRALTHDVLGYLAGDLAESRDHRAAAFAAVVETGHVQGIAQVIVGVADLALRRGEPEQAVRLLAVGAALLGLDDRANPDVARIEQDARNRLGETRFAEAAREGAEAEWAALVDATLGN